MNTLSDWMKPFWDPINSPKFLDIRIIANYIYECKLISPPSRVEQMQPLWNLAVAELRCGLIQFHKR